MGSRSGVIAMAIAACGAAALAQQASLPSPAQEPLPTFRAGVEVVQIDVFVTDAEGRPVTGLTAGDFEIVEQGTSRPIVAFSRVDLPIEQGLGPVAQWATAPDVAVNDVPEGRLYVFALDETGVEHALRARAFLRRFLEEHFHPNDRATVVLVGRGLVTDGQPFTRDPRLLLAAFDKFSGGFAPRQPCDVRNGAGTSVTVSGGASVTLPGGGGTGDHPAVRSRMTALRLLIEQIAELPGRKTMVYITECIGFDMFDVVDYRGGVLSLTGEDAHAAMAAATRGNVVIYPIDPRGLDASPGAFEVDVRMDLVALASATGGFALATSNSFSAAFTRIVQDASAYYALGFQAGYPRRDGRYVRVEVRVKRPGLQVRARDGYVAPRGPAPPAREARPPVLEALATPLTTRGVGLRVAAAPYKSSRRDAAVSLTLDVDTATIPFTEVDGMWRGRLHVSYGATDLRNRAHPGAVHVLDLSRPLDAPAPAGGTWLRIVSQLALPAGQYQVRVAAAGDARSGSVVYDLEVPDFTRGPLVLSGLSLTSAAAAAVQTLRPAPGGGGRQATRCRPPSCVVPLAIDGAPSAEDPLRDALPIPPTTARTFDRSDTLMLFAEVYENLRRPPAHTIDVTTSLRREEGEVVVAATERRVSTTPRRPSGGYGFTAQIPLQDVPPGRYVLHVEARSDAGAGATVSRAVPITIR